MHFMDVAAWKVLRYHLLVQVQPTQSTLIWGISLVHQDIQVTVVMSLHR